MRHLFNDILNRVEGIGGISVHYGLLGMGQLLDMGYGSGMSAVYPSLGPYDGTLICSIYPVDVIKSKIQTDALDPTKRQYKGMIDCVRKTWGKEGWRGFTGGLGPTLIR
jgi:hypothetical protein